MMSVRLKCVQVLSPEHGPQDHIEAPAALGRQRQQAPQAWPGKWGWNSSLEDLSNQKQIETEKTNMKN